MSRSKRIASVVKFSKAQEERAARRLGQAQQTMRSREEVLGTLEQHRCDYSERLFDQAASGFGIGSMLEYQEFLGRLSGAIGHQKGLVQNSHSECEGARSQWLQRHTRKSAIEKVMERLQRSEARAENRREQTESDGLSQRAMSAKILAFKTA